MEEKFLHAEGREEESASQFQTRRDSNKTSGTKSFAGFDMAVARGKLTFGADEKLKSKKLIDLLFKEGKSVTSNGFTLVYLITPLPTFFPAQAGFSVPKKHFKHAVDRNRIKRLAREAYRLNKEELYDKLASEKKQMALMWVYKGKELPPYENAVKAIQYCLKRLIKPESKRA